jgi:hypothetical protein
MKGRWIIVSVLALFLLLVLAAGLGQAQGPVSGEETGEVGVQGTIVGTAFTYQGQLIKSGTPVSGTCDFQFGLYDAATLGNQVGITQTKLVTVTNGLFTVQLNGGGEFGNDAFTGDARWLGIRVQCPGDPDYADLGRQELTATPYALSLRPGAKVAGSVPGDAVIIGDNSAPAGSSYGVKGLSASSDGVFGHATASSGALCGVSGQSDSSSGRGVCGHANASSGTTIGLSGQSVSPSGMGVNGWASAITGTTKGVYGQSDSTSGRGIYGRATAISGTTYGLYGQSDSTSGYGVYGTAPHTGTGVYGTAPHTGTVGIATATGLGDTNYGVYGESRAIGAGYGVYGLASNTMGGTTYGVWGQSNCGIGVGVRGQAPYIGVQGVATATSDTTYGVYGRSDSSSGQGVFGDALASSGTNYGVYGWSHSPSGYGGFFINSNGGILLAANNAYETSELEFKVDNDGDVYADGAYYCGKSSGCWNSGTGADVAERIDAIEALKPGDVVEIDPDHPGHFRRAGTAFSRAVAGVVSTNPAMTMGNDFDPEKDDWNDSRPLLALVGIVPVKASAENGPIRPGDLLVSAATPGRAMHAGENPPVGTVIGKALGSLEEGSGVIKMLVMLQ